VQVDPIKPTLKAPGIKRLKLEYDVLLSNFALKFNLRRFNQGDGTYTASYAVDQAGPYLLVSPPINPTPTLNPKP